MSNDCDKNYDIHIVLGTHWDREWRYNFQETRQRLIETLDQTIEILEDNPQIPSFTLDGQTLAIEDYLELRPENRPKIEKLVRQGRLLLGPWYCLPDMPVLTGESIVRNLLHGIITAEKLGKCLKEGYTCSSWGQISQMPQICRGFGLDTYYSYHGVPAHKFPAEFRWTAPDGSDVLFIRPISHGKGAFFLCQLKSMKPQNTERIDIIEPGNPLASKAYRITNLASTDESPFFSDDSDTTFDPEILYKTYQQCRHNAAKEVTTNHIMICESADQHIPNTSVVKMFDEIISRDKTSDKIHFSSLDTYFQEVKKNIDPQKLKSFKGEMRFPAKDNHSFSLLPTLSSRIYLKQKNRQTENLLTKWTEPFAAFASLLGKEYPKNDLFHAWKMTLTNHGHDNIGGCSIDTVHDDTFWRFEKSQELAQALLHRSLGHISRKIGKEKVAPNESRLIVFNPLPLARSEVIEIYLNLPSSIANKKLTVKDQHQNIIPHHVISISKEKTVSAEMPNFVCPKIIVRTVKISIDAQNIPATGYAEFSISAHNAKTDTIPAPKKQPLRSGKRWIENEHLKVTAKQNGTIDIHDKSTGQLFKGLHYFQDNGQDITSNIAWHYRPPKQDKTFSSRNTKAEITIVADSPLKAQIKVKYDLAIPKSLDMNNTVLRREGRFFMYTADKRSPELITIPIESTFTLQKNAQRVDVETVINNRALDHRLRLMFPTDIDTKHSFADSAFDVVKRPLHNPGNKDWHEIKTSGPITTNPMLRFVDIASKDRSLSIIVDGLPEYELIDDKRKTVAVTLLRATANGRADLDTTIPDFHGSQCQGKSSFRYAIYPHKGNWDQAKVINHADQHSLPLQAIQALGNGTGELPPSKSFIEFDKQGLEITAIKQSYKTKCTIIRVSNPTSRTINTQMTCGFKILSGTLANLLEQPLPDSTLEIHDNKTVILKVPPKKILTLRLKLSSAKP